MFDGLYVQMMSHVGLVNIFLLFSHYVFILKHHFCFHFCKRIDMPSFVGCLVMVVV
jgi:hypothetical protein